MALTNRNRYREPPGIIGGLTFVIWGFASAMVFAQSATSYPTSLGERSTSPSMRLVFVAELSFLPSASATARRRQMH
jgi:hypothetical protein